MVGGLGRAGAGRLQFNGTIQSDVQTGVHSALLAEIIVVLQRVEIVCE